MTPAPLSPHRFDRWTGWVLPAVIALAPWVVPYVFLRPMTGQTYFLELAALGLLVAHGIAWFIGWRPLPKLPVAVWGWMAVLAVSLAVSIGRSAAPWFSLRQALLPISGGLIGLFLISHPLRPQVLRRSAAAVGAVAVALAAYGIAQHLGFEWLRFSSQVQKNRVIATIGHPNYLGSVLGPALFFLLSAGLTARGRLSRAGGWLGLAVVLLCLMLAQARGVWLGTAVGLAIVVGGLAAPRVRHIVGGGRRVSIVAAGVAAAIAAAGFVAVALLPKLGAGVDWAARLASDREIKSRLYYWRAAIDLARAQPLFGRGYAMFDPLFWDYALALQKSPMGPFYYDMMPAISWRTPGHVHNEYLEVYCEQGAVGLVALLALIGIVLSGGWRGVRAAADPSRSVALLCMMGALVTGLIDAVFAFPWRLPVSLLVTVVVLACLWDGIHPRPAQSAA